MVPDLSEISGLGDYAKKTEKDRTLYLKGDKPFLIVNKNTIEVRCDHELSKTLQEKYESVMESRYYGRGGIEIVPAGQLSEDELEDLIRLSYNLSSTEDS